MISAGFIGGGEPAAPPPPTVEGPGSALNLQGFDWTTFLGGLDPTQKKDFNDALAGSIGAPGTMAETYSKAVDNQKTMFGWGLIANGINTLITNVAALAASGKMWDAQMNINDRRMEAMENVSADQRAVQERFAEVAEKADQNMNSPGGLQERRAEIEANRDIVMYERRAETQERLAALRSLDQSFGLRSEYPYGSPYAYS